MAFPQDQLARQQVAIFRALGENAAWNGAAGQVRVIRREADDQLHLDRGSLVEMGGTLRVRKSEVSAPAKGDSVQVFDDNGNPLADGLYRVSAEPMLDARKGVWTCQVQPTA